MSSNHKRGTGQADLTQTHGTVVCLENWKAIKVAGSGIEAIANADVATLANASESSMGEGAPLLTATQFGANGAAAKDAVTTSRPRFDPSLVPEPSASTKRFMEVMSGDESDPAFAVGAVLFFFGATPGAACPCRSGPWRCSSVMRPLAMRPASWCAIGSRRRWSRRANGRSGRSREASR